MKIRSPLLSGSLCCFAATRSSINNVNSNQHAISSKDGGGTSSWTDGGKVCVQIEKVLPSSSSSPGGPIIAARDAWIKHHWNQGGGLPIYIQTHKTVHDEEEKERIMRRVVWPIGMEETLVVKKEDEDEAPPAAPMNLEYTVTEPGWAFQSDLIRDSHSGVVSFAPIVPSSSSVEGTDGSTTGGSRGCKMVWDVEFETARFRKLYQAVTEFTIGTASRTVAESLATPRLLTLQSTLSGTSDPIEARNKWLDFVFTTKGGGLPLPPPIPYGDALKNEGGGGSARRNLLRIPPACMETVLSTLPSSPSSTDGTETSSLSAVDDEAVLTYQLANPGWLSFPFLMHTHLGRLCFVKSNDEGKVDVNWEVEIRPFPLVSYAVGKLVEMTASTILRNFLVHVSEPGARVEIKPPRGNADLVGGVESFGSVPKDTWLGGVLQAHLSDRRSTLEQTLSILQPWTWGRSGRGDEDDDITFGWSNGHIE